MTIAELSQNHIKQTSGLAYQSWQKKIWSEGQSLPWPSRQQESWRHFDKVGSWDSLLALPFKESVTTDLSAGQLQWLEQVKAKPGCCLVTVNGCWSKDLSTPKKQWPTGLHVCSFLDALQDEGLLKTHQAEYASWQSHRDCTRLYAANAALVTGGLWLRLVAGEVLTQPIYLLNLSTSTQISPIFLRNHFEFGENSQATMIDANCFTEQSKAQMSHVLSYWHLAGGAKVSHEQLMAGYDDDFISLVHHYIQQDEGSDYKGLRILTGGRAVQDLTHIALRGECAQSSCNSLVCPGASQQHQSTLVVDHQAPYTHSEHMAKMLIGTKGRGICYSDVTMQPGVTGSVSKQTNRNLALEDSASIFTQPRLCIHHDQVQCSHGATTGQLDEKMLHYMLSRGIDLKEARLLLILGFVSEMIELANASWCVKEAERQFHRQWGNLLGELLRRKSHD